MTSPTETGEPPRIRILEASHIYGVGRPIVVLEWRHIPAGPAAVNYWILIPEPACELKEGRYSFEVWSSEGAKIDLLVDAAQESCRCWLQSQIADELVRKHPELASLWPVVRLEPSSNSVFLTAWMHGQCKAAVERLSTRVHDKDLRAFLNLLRSIEVTRSEH
jgi:hypothetical protein